MRIFGFEITRSQKGASPKTGYALSNADREAALQVREANLNLRRQQAEIESLKLERQRIMQEAELERLKDELYGDEEDEQEDSGLEQMLVPILMAVLNKHPADIPMAQGIPAQAVQNVNLTDEEIRSVIKQFPKAQVKMAKALSDDVLRKGIIAHVPNINPESVERALAIFRSEF